MKSKLFFIIFLFCGFISKSQREFPIVYSIEENFSSPRKYLKELKKYKVSTDVNTAYQLNDSTLIVSCFGLSISVWVEFKHKVLNLPLTIPKNGLVKIKIRKDTCEVYYPEPARNSVPLFDEMGAEGVGVLSDINSPHSPPYYRYSDCILDKILVKNGKTEVAYRYRTSQQTYGYRVSFLSKVELFTNHSLPSRQNEFAQGRNGNWKSPGGDEIFSWGPALADLSFDGIPNIYDRNGALVPSSPEKKNALAYSPDKFFRTGIGTEQELRLVFPSYREAVNSLALAYGRKNGTFPENSRTSYRLEYEMREIKLFSDIKGGVFFTYRGADSDLPQRGANLSSVLGSILGTPPTFDTSYGMERKEALSSAWQLPDGKMRTYATSINNPYSVSTLPDNEKNNLITTGMYFSGRILRTQTSGNINYQYSNDDLKLGTLPQFNPFPEGHLLEYKEKNSTLNATINSSFDLGSRFSGFVKYNFSFSKANLGRKDGFGFTETSFNMGKAKEMKENYFEDNRNVHQLSYGVRRNFRQLTLFLNNSHYFSNTASTTINLYPDMLVTYSRSLGSYRPLFGNFEAELSASISPNESPLIFNNTSVVSTVYSTQEYSKVYPFVDIFSSSNLELEKLKSMNLTLSFSGDKLTLKSNLYLKRTDGFILPIATDNIDFRLINCADVENRGIEVNLSYKFPINYKTRVSMTLGWSMYRNKVLKLKNTEISNIPIVGFKDLFIGFKEGESANTIYGSSYLRNEVGKIIIDDSGFPVSNPEIKAIGSTIPKWTSFFSGNIEFSKFKFKCVFDFSKGGAVWNGTRAFMDYAGTSVQSANDRKVTNYVFEGVTSEGEVNTKAVDFYDPTKNLNENYRVRYGQSGIGEAYIEDATFFRLSQLSLSFYPKGYYRKILENLEFIFSANNLWVYTPFTNVDPLSPLFDTQLGRGLHLFNLPTTRTFSLSVRLTFK